MVLIFTFQVPIKGSVEISKLKLKLLAVKSVYANQCFRNCCFGKLKSVPQFITCIGNIEKMSDLPVSVQTSPPVRKQLYLSS